MPIASKPFGSPPTQEGLQPARYRAVPVNPFVPDYCSVDPTRRVSQPLSVKDAGSVSVACTTRSLAEPVCVLCGPAEAVDTRSGVGAVARPRTPVPRRLNTAAGGPQSGAGEPDKIHGGRPLSSHRLGQLGQTK